MNEEWLSPRDIFYGSRPRLRLLPLFQPAYHRLPRQQKTDPRACMCYFLNSGYNHGRNCYRLLDAETERVFHSRDVTWHHPETTWITSIRTAPIKPAKDIYVPMPQSVPVAAPSRTRYRSASSRTGSDTTTTAHYTNVELFGSDPLAR